MLLVKLLLIIVSLTGRKTFILIIMFQDTVDDTRFPEDDHSLIYEPMKDVLFIFGQLFMFIWKLACIYFKSVDIC